MSIPLYILACTLLAVFVLISARNWTVVIKTYLYRNAYSPSMIFVVGGLCGAIGILLIPELRYLFWTTFIIDLTIPCLLGAFPAIARDSRKISWKNLLKQYSGPAPDGGTMTLSLFRENVFKVDREINTDEKNSHTASVSYTGRYEDSEKSLTIFSDEDILLYTFTRNTDDTGTESLECVEDTQNGEEPEYSMKGTVLKESSAKNRTGKLVRI